MKSNKMFKVLSCYNFLKSEKYDCVLIHYVSAGQVISASWDKRVKFWDPRSTVSRRCLSSLGMEVESMSLSGLNLMVAHQSSVHLYDLRYLDGLVQAKEYFMDVKINCVRSNSELEGIATIDKFPSFVEIHSH